MKIVKTIRVIIGILSVIFAVSLHSFADSSVHKVDYKIMPMLNADSPHLKISLSFKGNASGKTQFALPLQFAGQTELFKSIKNLRPLTDNAQISDTEKPQIKTITHKPGTEIRLEYDLIQDWSGTPEAGSASRSEGGGYRPVLQKDYFHFLGWGGFILPEVAERAKLKVSIEWLNIPKAFSIANSFGAQKLKQSFTTDAELLRSSVFVGGDFRINEKKVKGKAVYTAIRGNWKFTNDEFAELVAKVIAAERDFWKDHSQSYYLVTLIPLAGDPQALSIGGTGLTNSFATFVTPNATLDDTTFLISHEYFHNWNYAKLGGLEEPQRLLYWFSEGFTDYYTYLLLLRSGIYDLKKYTEKYNQLLSDYYMSPVRNIDNQRVLQDFFTDYSVSQLPYRRGMFLAAKWNRIIREQSNNAKSLDNVMLDIFSDAKKKKYGKLTKERIISYLNKYAKYDFGGDVEKYIERGETIGNFDGILGKCLESFEAGVGKYELGFDAEILIKEKRVSNVVAGSAAYEAGLRDGQKVAGASFEYNNPNQEALVVVDENGQKKKITFMPVTKEKIKVPQFRLKNAISPEALNSCLSDF